MKFEPIASKINLNCQKTWSLICEGNTLGCFQIDSQLGQSICKQIKPNNINELADVIALMRPACLEGKLEDGRNIVEHYKDRKHKKEESKPLDKSLIEITGSTQNLLLYQEQAMQIAQKLSGMSLVDTDTYIRKGLGKKKPELIAKARKLFLEGCKKVKLVDESTANYIFDIIEKGQRYSFNRCFHYKTKISLPNGTTKTIQDLYRNNYRGPICSFDPRINKYKTSMVEDIKTSGNTLTYKLTLQNGDSVIVSRGHKFITDKGIKPLKNISLNDRIKTTTKIGILPELGTQIDPLKAKFIGMLLAEGNLCHPSTLYFCSSDNNELEEFSKLCNLFKNTKPVQDKGGRFVHTKRKNISKEQDAFEFCKKLGILKLTATTKYIPQQIKLASDESIAACLAGMWAGDGSMFENGGGYYTSSSEQLITDFRFLMLRLGILTTIEKKKFKYNNEYKIGWTSRIVGKKSIQNFHKTIAKYLHGKKLKSFLKIANNKFYGSSYDIPFSFIDQIKDEILYAGFKTYKEPCIQANISPRVLNSTTKKDGISYTWLEKLNNILKSDFINELLNSDAVYLKIKSITPHNRANIYDITVKNTHTLIADNILAMNSHSISYAYNSYITAYAKTHFPHEFFTSYLNHSTDKPDSFDEINRLINNAREMNVAVLSPDILMENNKFELNEDKNIIFGLSYIKGIGESAINEIKEYCRKYNIIEMEWTEVLVHILDRINKTVAKALIGSGALDFLNVERKKMLYDHEHLLKLTAKEKTKISGLNLENYVDLQGIIEYIIEEGTGKNAFIANKNRLNIIKGILYNLKNPPYSLDDDSEFLCGVEESLLGISLRHHRLDDKKVFNINTYCSDFKNDGVLGKEGIILAAQIDGVKRTKTKHDDPMAFLRVSDRTGFLDSVVVFPGKWDTYKDLLDVGNTIIIYGSLGRGKSLVLNECELL